jgi:hypothetical protein
MKSIMRMLLLTTVPPKSIKPIDAGIQRGLWSRRRPQRPPATARGTTERMYRGWRRERKSQARSR